MYRVLNADDIVFQHGISQEMRVELDTRHQLVLTRENAAQIHKCAFMCRMFGMCVALDAYPAWLQDAKGLCYLRPSFHAVLLLRLFKIRESVYCYCTGAMDWKSDCGVAGNTMLEWRFQ